MGDFLRTKEGGLTAAFFTSLAGFAVVMAGLSVDQAVLYGGGFFLMTAAMLYSPIKEKLLGRRK